MTNEIFDPFNLPDSVCAHLCCKEMVCGKGPPRDPALVYPGDEECKAFFWCEETQDAQGPEERSSASNSAAPTDPAAPAALSPALRPDLAPFRAGHHEE